MLLAVCAGCDGLMWNSGPENYIQPTVAVLKFENRAPFSAGWDLPNGMADILVDRLLATRRFHVIERAELASLLNEQRLQGSGATRSENRTPAGRIKNVQFYIKGTITDFGHVANSSSFLGTGNWNILGGNARAVMSMTLSVIDVESGEIICSESLSESVAAQNVEVKAAYAGVAFGGQTFYQTPLGRATASVVERAVKRVTAIVASQPFVPKIALVQQDNTVILNGGADRNMKIAADFDVLEPGPAILDPDSGDVLGYQPGKMVARVRVVQVLARYSLATVLDGQPSDIRPGQRCRRPNALAAR